METYLFLGISIFLISIKDVEFSFFVRPLNEPFHTDNRFLHIKITYLRSFVFFM